MSRTITAMYDSRSEAEAAKDQLRSALSIDARIVDQSTTGGSSGSSTFGSSSSSGSSTLGGSDDSYNRSASSYDSSGSGSSSMGSSSSYDSSSSSSSGSSGSGGGFWSGLKDVFMADDDRHSYEEGVRRGGFLLTAHVPEEQADEAVAILDKSGSVDFDQREQEWRSQGWAGYQGQRTGSAMGTTAAMGASSGMTGESSGMTGESSGTQEEHIPIVEEQLRVGKREVNRGSTRVRSYVEEVPVHESVRLHEEHVNVERRPVDQPLSGADLDKGALFQDRTIEMTETAEEAVVGKEARVKEEVVVNKTATDRTEEIDDTVRRTNVDIDRDGADIDRGRTDSDRGGFNR
ncbi:MAG: hypothetical protein AVDCRST_MAG31-2413 [uncultured Sphingomonas sp.]|uniref:DUF2382 domain-containing protein n=1 Tax=uncultured Sphingomonas sp. TaxID=158754 RepID=A0A6J4TV78_9SPHN|nr:YsnF/AvaK domain-containing protein [uncultured Sphingomonas sp.]CAA9531299.1 MAG: hypothetical protein AVDCRST_MAG31-2413 [uncultured Sphingomonas sp.]